MIKYLFNWLVFLKVYLSVNCISLNQDYDDLSSGLINLDDLGQVLAREITELSNSNNDLSNKPTPFDIDYDPKIFDIIKPKSLNISRFDGSLLKDKECKLDNKTKKEDTKQIPLKEEKESSSYYPQEKEKMKNLEKRETDQINSIDNYKGLNNYTNGVNVTNNSKAVQGDSVNYLRLFRGLVNEDDERYNVPIKSNKNSEIEIKDHNSNMNMGNQVENKPKLTIESSELDRALPQPINLLSKENCVTCDLECECNFKKILQMGRVLDAIFERIGSNLRKDLGVCKRGKLFDQCPIAGDDEVMEKVINEMVGCIKQTLRGQLSPKCCAPLPRELYSFLIWLLHGSEGGPFCPPTVPDCKTRYSYLFHENQHKPHACGSASHSDKTSKKIPPKEENQPNKYFLISNMDLQNKIETPNNQGQFLPSAPVKNQLGTAQIPQSNIYINPNLEMDNNKIISPVSNYDSHLGPNKPLNNAIGAFVYPEDIDIDYSDPEFNRQIRDLQNSYFDDSIYNDENKDINNYLLNNNIENIDGFDRNNYDIYSDFIDNLKHNLNGNSLINTTYYNENKQNDNDLTYRSKRANVRKEDEIKTINGSIFTSRHINMTRNKTNSNNFNTYRINNSMFDQSYSNVNSKLTHVDNNKLKTLKNNLSFVNLEDEISNSYNNTNTENIRDTHKDLCTTDRLNSKSVASEPNLKEKLNSSMYKTSDLDSLIAGVVSITATVTCQTTNDGVKRNKNVTLPVETKYLFNENEKKPINVTDKILDIENNKKVKSDENTIIEKENTSIATNKPINLKKSETHNKTDDQIYNDMKKLNLKLKKKKKNGKRKGKLDYAYYEQEDSNGTNREEDDEDDMDFKTEEEDGCIETNDHQINSFWPDETLNGDFETEINNNFVSSFFKRPFISFKFKPKDKFISTTHNVINQKRSNDKVNNTGNEIFKLTTNDDIVNQNTSINTTTRILFNITEKSIKLKRR